MQTGKWNYIFDCSAHDMSFAVAVLSEDAILRVVLGKMQTLADPEGQRPFNAPNLSYGTPTHSQPPAPQLTG